MSKSEDSFSFFSKKKPANYVGGTRQIGRWLAYKSLPLDLVEVENHLAVSIEVYLQVQVA